MDGQSNVLEVQQRELDSLPHSVVITAGKYYAQPFILDQWKARWLWEKMSAYRTLFSDLTRGDIDNFVNLLILPHTFWLEIRSTERNQIVGIIYINDVHTLSQAVCHVVFFDRNLRDKDDICRRCLEVMFKLFNFRRLNATIPAIYHATLRLAERVGFVREGVRRESVLIGGNWIDEVEFGILYSEVFNGSNNEED